MIDYVKKIVNRLDEQKACGFCWVFSAPLEEQTGNIRQMRDDECKCVHIYITRYEDQLINNYPSAFNSVPEKREITSISLLAMIDAELSENNWDEIKDYPITDSRWKKYLEPIKNCLTESAFSKWCEILGYPLRITSFRRVARPNPNIYDRNFVGWEYQITFEKRLR